MTIRVPHRLVAAYDPGGDKAVRARHLA
jgi:hypothetical protein